jgi:mono/diheme cytochrome c family protein
MGNFHLTDAEAHALVQYFQAWDAAEIPEADPLLRDEALAARREQVLAVLGYVLDRSVGCVQCHYVEGRPSAGAEAGQTYNAGPDLSRVYERLRPNWLRAWMDNPGAIYPGTVMVQVQQIPQQSRPELFRDRADWLDAIVQLLLRWDYWREDPEVRRVLGAGRN